MIAWIYFRADSVLIANDYVQSLFKIDSFTLGLFTKTSKSLLFFAICIFSIVCLLLFEKKAYKKSHKEVRLTAVKGLFILLCIVFMGAFKNPSDFIYFQF